MTEPVVASIVTAMPGGGHSKSFIPLQLEWDENYLNAMALAMRTLGPWFMGRESRTIEGSFKVARDLLILLNQLGYLPPEPGENGSLRPGWTPPLPEASGVIAGSPGYFTPPNTDINTLNEMNWYASTWTGPEPWTNNQWVVTGDGTSVTYLGEFNPTGEMWVERGNKSAITPEMYFPTDPAITSDEQTEADELYGLGYIPASTASWDTENDWFSVGSYRFTWNGTNWITWGAG